jgi:hypothetical protein
MASPAQNTWLRIAQSVAPHKFAGGVMNRGGQVGPLVTDKIDRKAVGRRASCAPSQIAAAA